jgi:hypothetical protein
MTFRKKYPFVALATFLFAGLSLSAATINVTNLLFSTVSAAVALAAPGDVVQLPVGTNIWTQGLSISGITVKGAGTNKTVIIDEVSRNNGGGQLFTLNGMAGKLTELSNLQLCGGVTNTSINYYGTIACSGSSNTSWRVDNIIFNRLYAKNICTYGNSCSVIDHNVFYEKSIAIEDNSYFQNDGFGDQSYAWPPTYGLNSSNVLYIEDNYFTNTVGYVASVGVCDGEGGARVVFRHNTVWNDLFNNHGTESGGRLRSERSFEIYNNSFNFSPSSPAYPGYAIAMIRGGSGVIYSNTCTGYNLIVALRNYRYTTSFCGQWSPFCGANGITSWDSNSPILYLSGTNSSPSGSAYLQVTGANWTNNQWYGYTLLNTNSGLFSVITSNTSNKMYYIGSDSASASIVPGTVMTFNSGDHFQLHLVYAALDQPGRGSGDLLRDNGQDSFGKLITINTVTGTSSWPRQVLEPIYCWSNILNGAPASIISDYPTLQSGRDFYNNTPKPGYTPYTYPHPLVSGSTNGSSQLLPPTNLHIIEHSP